MFFIFCVNRGNLYKHKAESQYMLSYRKKFRMNKIILMLLLIQVPQDLSGGPVEDISLIKSLLGDIFRRYKMDMESLQNLVEITTGSLSTWKEDVSARLHDLEFVLGNKQKSGGKVERQAFDDNNEAQENIFGLRAAVATLEDLGRITPARTCRQLSNLGIHNSGEYFIDPDGAGLNSAPVKVHCDMKSGSTRVDHSLQEQEISPCKERGCFVRPVKYKMSMKQIISLISLSSHCEQYIRYDCLNATMNSLNDSNAWWMDRSDVLHFYWSGDSGIEASDGLQGTCYCHLQDSCISKEHRCNCDAGESIWSYDDGQLTDKDQLPVTKLNFGNFYEEGQAAKFHLGPLYCSGEKVLPLEMDSCESLWLAGTTKPGYQIIKTKSDSFPKVVYCDMNKLPGTPGFQRTYGSPGNLRDFVAFDAIITEDITDNYRYIGFSETILNIGGGLNIKDGIFEVPVSGTYMFTVHGLPVRNRPFIVQIQRNNRPIASLSNNKSGTSMAGQTVLVEVAAGDEIRLFNAGGEVTGAVYDNNFYFHFTGVLLNSYSRQ